MTLGETFARVAAERPDHPAIAIRDSRISYGEMDDRARRWARRIVDRLGRPAERIGVFGSRSEVSYMGVIAALYSGGAFVPLNPRFPPARTGRMIASGELDAILADRQGLGKLDAVLQEAGVRPFVLTPDELCALATAPRLEQLPAVSMDSIAYLLFTSGSTGLPKGVPITQANVRAYLQWGHERYRFSPQDRFSQTFDQTFDLSVHDQFLCWESGATLYSLSPAELLAPTKFIQRNELTAWFSVPSVVAHMRKRGTLSPGAFPSLRWSLFCGEPLAEASAAAWKEAAPNSTVENLYGPTELTIACCVHRWEPAISPRYCVNGMVSIGAPFPGLKARILDSELRPAPDGEAGELCISGAQTSPGYWRNPAKTAESFIELADGRYYRTGDRVVPLENGEFACLGRVDNQVKVLGFRVELGEIEAVLQRDPKVVQAIAIGWPVVDGSAQSIVAFVTGSDVDTDALQALCKESLSDYMVPSAIHVLSDMPLNANGKVDRLALTKLL